MIGKYNMRLKFKHLCYQKHTLAKVFILLQFKIVHQVFLHIKLYISKLFLSFFYFIISLGHVKNNGRITYLSQQFTYIYNTL